MSESSLISRACLSRARLFFLKFFFRGHQFGGHAPRRSYRRLWELGIRMVTTFIVCKCDFWWACGLFSAMTELTHVSWWRFLRKLLACILRISPSGRNLYEGNKPETEQFVFLLFTAWCMVFKRQDGPVVLTKVSLNFIRLLRVVITPSVTSESTSR